MVGLTLSNILRGLSLIICLSANQHRLCTSSSTAWPGTRYKMTALDLASVDHDLDGSRAG